MTKKRTAILFGGSAYSTQFSLESQIKNLIDPNEADVFIVTTRGMKRRKTPAGDIPLAEQNEKWNEKNAGTIVDKTPLSDEEIQNIKNVLGDRLKGFLVFEDTPDYYDYVISERKKMVDIANSYIHESVESGLPAPFRGKLIGDSGHGTVRCVVDQYHHIKKAYELMEQYEKENGFQYEYVIRARIDFICPFEFNHRHYTLNHDSDLLFVCGTVRGEEREWCDEHTFFCRRKMATKLFPHLDKMGMLNMRKYNTVEGDNDMIFDPEVQFSLLLHELNIPTVTVKIFRTAKYSAGNDGFDYFNYMFRREFHIDHDLHEAIKSPTDINEHLNTLLTYAKECESICELGTRYANSTLAFMASRKKVVAYDPQWNERMDYIRLLAESENLDFEMRIENPTPEDGESLLDRNYDLMLIDTNHHSRQMAHELKLHAHKINKFLIFHDTTTFWSGLTGGQGGEAGLQYAIENFLENKKDEWRMKERFMHNNGLMILERIGRE